MVEDKIKDIDELKKILDTNTKPSNIASFFFSLPENPAAANLDRSVIDFDVLLRDDENFKIVFIIFYTAIIYHISLCFARGKGEKTTEKKLKKFHKRAFLFWGKGI